MSILSIAIVSEGRGSMHTADMYDEAVCRFGMAVAHVGKAFICYTSKNTLEALYLRAHHHPSMMGGTIAARTIFAAMISVT